MLNFLKLEKKIAVEILKIQSNKTVRIMVSTDKFSQITLNYPKFISLDSVVDGEGFFFGSDERF